MALMVIMTVGFLISLFLLGFVLSYATPNWGHPEDSIRVDPLPEDEDKREDK